MAAPRAWRCSTCGGLNERAVCYFCGKEPPARPMTESAQGATWILGDEKDGLPKMIRWPVTNGRQRFTLFSSEEQEELRDLLNTYQTENTRLQREVERLQGLVDEARDWVVLSKVAWTDDAELDGEMHAEADDWLARAESRKPETEE